MNKRVLTAIGIGVALLMIGVVVWISVLFKGENNDSDALNSANEMDKIEVHVHSYEIAELLVEGDDFDARFKCSGCDEEYIETATSEQIGLPVVNIIGDISKVSKDNVVDVTIRYDGGGVRFESAATLKVQGNTSANYPKKNYTVKFLNDAGKKNRVELVKEWGAQSKYCLKANYIDSTASRNVVSAKLWGQIVKSRDKNDRLESLVNGGAIDGYPVVVYLEGTFLGLYTMNIPKDGWMMGMSEGNNIRQAMLFQDSWSKSGKLGAPIERDATTGNLSDGWKVEFCSTDDDEWVYESFNEFIDFLDNSDEDTFETHISEYTDVERSIDAMIYTCFIGADDNLSKNMIWVTFDGKKWIPSMYDMDSTWGLEWDGSTVSTEPMPLLDRTVLYGRLVYHYRDDIYARIQELLGNVLSEENIEEVFGGFMGGIPEYVYNADREKWEEAPNPEGGDLKGILEYARASIEMYREYVPDALQ